MLSRKLRAATVGLTLCAALALGISPASAAILRSTGCIEWSASGGCAVTQTCQVDTEARTWYCYTVPHNGTQPVMEGGRY